MAAAKLVSVNVKMDREVAEKLEYIAARFDFETDGDAILKCIEGFYGRQLACDDYAGKSAKVKEAIKAGAKLPADVKFRRYTPTFKQSALDAPGTERDVATWSHAAPERRAFERPEPKTAAKGPKVRKGAAKETAAKK